METLLITGGTGFIGSHTAVACVSTWKGKILVVDNFRNSHRSVANTLESLSPNIHVQECDLMDFRQVTELFMIHNIKAVIHFAALKSVAESVAKPLLYYNTNLTMLLNVTQAMLDQGVKTFIFSSSACVYESKLPSETETPTDPDGYDGYDEDAFRVDVSSTCPYGQTKRMGERILYDLSVAHPDLRIIILRYFNPLGALTLTATFPDPNSLLKNPDHHRLAILGENPVSTPNNIMPVLLRAIRDQQPFYIYGDDYKTADGTCERDYIHVMDVAEGHVAALQNARAGFVTCNLGTGRPTSVQELLRRTNQLTKTPFPIHVSERRPGDVSRVFADASWAEAVWGWKATRSLDTMLIDALNWAKHLDSTVSVAAISETIPEPASVQIVVESVSDGPVVLTATPETT